MSVAAFRRKIESVGSEASWKHMPVEQFKTQFVDVAVDFPEERLAQVIQQLDEHTFEWWAKKLWTEQDIPPSADYDAYEQSKPMLQLLKRSLILRLVIEERPTVRTHIQQQLGLLGLILGGAQALSELTGLPMEAPQAKAQSKERRSATQEPTAQELSEFREWKKRQKK